MDVEGFAVEQHVTALYHSLVASGPSGRQRVARKLTELGLAAVPSLLALLPKVDQSIGHVILAVLETLGDQRAVDPIVDILRTGTDDMRAHAAHVLGILGEPRAVPALTDALTDQQYRVRLQSVVALGKIGDARAVNPLLALLTPAHKGLRSSAARALGQIGDERSFEPLLRALHDKRSWGEGFRGAASALRTSGDARGTDLLLTLVIDPDPVWREIAAYGLGRSMVTRAVEPLLGALSDVEVDVREAAADSLGLIGDARAVEPLRVMATNDSAIRPATITRALARLGAEGEAALASLLTSTFWAMQEEAADALGAAGTPGGVGPLIQALTDVEARVRSRAARALGLIGDHEAFDALVAALTDSNESVRGEAAAALAAIGDRRALEPLLAALFDAERKPDVRGRVAYAVTELGSDRARDYLLDKLSHGDNRERAIAAKTLDDSDDPQVVDALVAALQDAEPTVRQHAAWALGRLGAERAIEPLAAALLRERDERLAWALGMLGDRAIPSLQALLHGADTSLCRLALIVLGRLGSDTATNLIISALADTDWHMRLVAVQELRRGKEPHYGLPVAAQAVDPLIALLHDEKEEVRRAAVEALGQTNDPRAFAPLVKLLSDDHKEMRACAAHALGELRDKRAVAPFVQALEEQDNAIRACAAEALGHLEDRGAVIPLIRALDDEDPEVRQAAVFSLGRLGDPRALPALRSMQHDDKGVTSWGSNAEAAARVITFLETGRWPARRAEP